MLRVFEDTFKDEKSKLAAPKAFVKGGVIDPTLVKPIILFDFYVLFSFFRKKSMKKIKETYICHRKLQKTRTKAQISKQTMSSEAFLTPQKATEVLPAIKNK